MAASCGGPRRVEELPESVEVVRRVARREAMELGVHREAVADLHLAPLDARVETVERPDGRPAVDRALEAVDAAMAGADELLRRLHVAHRAAEVGAARGDRHVGLGVLPLDDLVLPLVEAAHVDRGLPGLADL